MPDFDSSSSATRACFFRARHLMFAGSGAVLLMIANASSAAAAQPPTATRAAPFSTQANEEIILRPPDVVRHRLPSSGLRAPPGLMYPEIISLTRAVSYADLDLSRPGDVREMQRRVGNTARDICQELAQRFSRQSGGYVSSTNDC